MSGKHSIYEFTKTNLLFFLSNTSDGWKFSGRRQFSRGRGQYSLYQVMLSLRTVNFITCLLFAKWICSVFSVKRSNDKREGLALLTVHYLSFFRSSLLLHANFVVRLFTFFWAAVLRVCVERGISEDCQACFHSVWVFAIRDDIFVNIITHIRKFVYFLKVIGLWYLSTIPLDTSNGSNHLETKFSVNGIWITCDFIGNFIWFHLFLLKIVIDDILLARYYWVYIFEAFNCLDDPTLSCQS